MVSKYGVKVLQSVKHAIELGKANGNTMWQDAKALDVNVLHKMECFDFRNKRKSPAGNYECTTLYIAFDCKQDLRRKASCVPVPLLAPHIPPSSTNKFSI
eukprot:13035989-Ditylum_brightwellii.AAC.1